MTVSRVINGSPLVKPKTKLKVETVIAKHNYIPSHSASMIRRKTSNVLGLIMPKLEYSFFEPFINRLCAAARAKQYSLEIFFTDFDINAEEACVHELAARRARGIIIIGAQVHDAVLLKINEYVQNILFIGLPYPSIRSKVRFSYVGFEDDAVTRIAAERLASNGHRNILYVSSKTRPYKITGIDTQRLVGFKKHADALGMRIAGTIELNNDDYDELLSPELLRSTMRDNAVTAAFCENDFAAMKLYRATHDTGIRIPDDLSVIGVDDLFCAKYLTPPLSTIALPYDKTADDIIAFFMTANPKPLRNYYEPVYRDRASIKNIA